MASVQILHFFPTEGERVKTGRERDAPEQGTLLPQHLLSGRPQVINMGAERRRTAFRGAFASGVSPGLEDDGRDSNSPVGQVTNLITITDYTSPKGGGNPS
ncbi:unnamed protein product [Pleuronectes platessa]|uniref:Uncharacterized protein n=1 Tax=Pleuronectes platessa TaxID=8262 RepID=A0A9N7UNY0_PLEPL|nr:unnamed protein product [Pleuronectes platessa]